MIFFTAVLFELLVLFFLSRTLTRLLSRFVSIEVLSLLFLPGIIFHELSHLFIAGILFVPVGEIEFIPKRTEEGIKLGSVAIGKTDPVRRAIIGVSPIFVGLWVLFIIAYYLSQNGSIAQTIELQTIGVLFLLAYVTFTIANTMFSSTKDLEGFLEVLLTFLFFSVVFYIFTIISGIYVNLSFPFEQVGKILKPLLFVLSVAILLDVLAISFIKILHRR